MDRRTFLRAGSLGALSLLGAGMAAPALAETAQQEGGTKDLQTGLVWSPSCFTLYGGTATWSGAQQAAAAYSVQEVDALGNVAATYDDWRVPRVTELQTAIRNGTLNQVWDRRWFSRRVHVWSGEDRGKAGWAVEVWADAAGQVLAAQSGRAVALDKRSWTEAFFVRP